MTLGPVSVEITYGLGNRDGAAGAHAFQDIVFSGEITYGDLLLQNEIDSCIYNFEAAGGEPAQYV